MDVYGIRRRPKTPFRSKKVKWLNEYELPKTIKSKTVKLKELIDYASLPKPVYFVDMENKKDGWTVIRKIYTFYEDIYYFYGHDKQFISDYGKTWLLFKEEVDYKDIPTIEEERLKLIA